MAIKAYKGFDEGFTCRGFQFEVGKTYTHRGEIRICKSGFHACKNPFDIWEHYPCTTTRYAVVTLDGIIDEKIDKIAAERITIDAEISLHQIIEAGIDYLMTNNMPVTSTLDSDSQLAASGDYSQIAASGDDSQLAASGDYSRLAVSGAHSRLAASGVRSQLAVSGVRSQLAVSGDDSRLAVSGDYSQIAASGDYNWLAASGNDSICIVAAMGGRAKVGKRGAIALAYHDGKRFRIAIAYEGENGIEANTWYEVNNCGEFLKVDE